MATHQTRPRPARQRFSDLLRAWIYRGEGGSEHSLRPDDVEELTHFPADSAETAGLDEAVLEVEGDPSLLALGDQGRLQLLHRHLPDR